MNKSILYNMIKEKELQELTIEGELPTITAEIIEESKKYFSGFKDLPELKQEIPIEGLEFLPDREDNNKD